MGAPLSAGAGQCSVSAVAVAPTSAGGLGWLGTVARVWNAACSLHSDSPISFLACAAPAAGGFSGKGSKQAVGSNPSSNPLQHLFGQAVPQIRLDISTVLAALDGPRLLGRRRIQPLRARGSRQGGAKPPTCM